MMHGTGGIVATYEAAGFTNRTFVIGDHVGFGNHNPLGLHNDELEAQMADWPVPSIAVIEGTFLANFDPGYFNEEPQFQGQTGYPGVDGYLYVGRRDYLLREPRSAQALLDANFVAELDQRADRLGAPAQAPRRPASMIQNELNASVFNYDPSPAQGPGGGPGGM
jgi:hypothetical protein